MAGTNDFRWFASSGIANVMSQASWIGDGSTADGYPAGILPSAKLNKALRQSSAGTAVLGAYMAQVLNQNVVDNGDLNATLVRLWDTILTGSYFVDTGSASSILIAAPAGLTFPAPYVGMRITVKAVAPPTGATTLNWMGTGSFPVRYSNSNAIVSGDWTTNALLDLEFNGTFWIMMSIPLTAIRQQIQILHGGQSFITAGSTTFTVPADIFKLHGRAWGAGGGGGGAVTAPAAGAGGGGGEFREGWFTVVPGAVLPVTVGAGGAGGSAAGGNGANGGSTILGDGSGGTLMQCNAGIGGQGGIAGNAGGFGAGGSGGTGGFFTQNGDIGGIQVTLSGIGAVMAQGGPAFGGNWHMSFVTGTSSSAGGTASGAGGGGGGGVDLGGGGRVGGTGNPGTLILDW